MSNHAPLAGPALETAPAASAPLRPVTPGLVLSILVYTALFWIAITVVDLAAIWSVSSLIHASGTVELIIAGIFALPGIWAAWWTLKAVIRAERSTS